MFSGQFSLFSIVRFKNDACSASSDARFGLISAKNKCWFFKKNLSTNGTCFTSSQCSSKGGSADGNCAVGFGVCCKFIVFLLYISEQSLIQMNYVFSLFRTSTKRFSWLGIISTSTCGSIISENITYIRNPGYEKF